MKKKEKEEKKKYNKQRARWLRWSDRGEMKASFTKRNLLELLLSKGAKHSLPIFKTSINTWPLAYMRYYHWAHWTRSSPNTTINRINHMRQNFSSACLNLKIGDFLCIFLWDSIDIRTYAGPSESSCFCNFKRLWRDLFTAYESHTHSRPRCLVLSLPCIAWQKVLRWIQLMRHKACRFYVQRNLAAINTNHQVHFVKLLLKLFICARHNYSFRVDTLHIRFLFLFFLLFWNSSFGLK